MAAGLLFLSGAAALSHQLLWTRRLVDVLGAGQGTFARVVGVFFAALALGAAWDWLGSPSGSCRGLDWTARAWQSVPSTCWSPSQRRGFTRWGIVRVRM